MSEQGKGGLGEFAARTKEFLTDDKIDSVADAIKSVAPDSVDAKVDQLAEKAKKAND